MIACKNLSVSIDQKTVLDKVTLHLAPGSVHAIMGQNGSGKSSLAHTIMGLPSYEIIGGSLQFDGLDLASMPMHERARAGIFLAFQQPIAIPGVTVFQFLKEIFTTANKVADAGSFQEILQTTFEQVGLAQSFLYRGLHENFSGGEKKRLEIAQMLLLEPKLIVLDEIDSGLDVDALKTIGNCVQQYLQQRPDAACLIITHYRRILDYVHPDFVHVMHQGTIVRSGDGQLSHEIEAQGYTHAG